MIRADEFSARIVLPHMVADICRAVPQPSKAFAVCTQPADDVPRESQEIIIAGLRRQEYDLLHDPGPRRLRRCGSRDFELDSKRRWARLAFLLKYYPA